MALGATFDSIPKSITSEGSVRFFPVITGSTDGNFGASTFLWSFGDDDIAWSSVNGSNNIFVDNDPQIFDEDDVVIFRNTAPGGFSINTKYYVIDGSMLGAIILSATMKGAGINATSTTNGIGLSRTSSVWSPVHEYPVITGPSPYDVMLIVENAAGSSYPTTVKWAITQDIEDNVPSGATDVSFPAVSVLLYNDDVAMLANRIAWDGCSMYLSKVKAECTIDKIGTLTFSLLDVGNSTSDENSLVCAGTNVILYQGNTIIFSGLVRRVTQGNQSYFSAATNMKLWEFECDSDLARLQRKTTTTTDGNVRLDSPGNILRTVLEPTPYEWDSRGIINCTDGRIFYNIDTNAASESAGSRYEHLMALQALTNYDIVSRSDFLTYEFSSFDATDTFTFSDVAWGTDEFAGCFIAVVGDSEYGVQTFGRVSSNTGTTITSTGIIGAANSPTTTGWLVIHRGYKIDFANDLSQPSVVRNFDVNSTIFAYSDNDDQRKFATKFTARGKDVFGQSISVTIPCVHAYDNDRQMFDNCTTISMKTDGYVYKCGYYDYGVGASGPYWPCLDNNEVWLYGKGFALEAGDPVYMDDLSGSLTATYVNSLDGEFDLQNGLSVTKLHLVAINQYDYSGSGFLLSTKLYVEDSSLAYGATYPSPVNFKVGEESIGATAIGNHSTYGNFIRVVRTGSDSEHKCYPHDVGCLVARKFGTVQYPTEATPEDFSAISDYGIISEDRVVDGDIFYGNLDTYATNMALGFGNFYRKATCWTPVIYGYVKRVGAWYKGYQASLSTPIMVSDRISITEYSGATPIEYQIVSIIYDFDAGMFTMQLGDFEKNPYTSMEQKTNAINRTLT